MKRIDAFFDKYVVMENEMLWEEPYDTLEAAKDHVELTIKDNGDDPADFTIYKLVKVTSPKQTKIEWE